MRDNTCISCGRIIPEGRHVCLACSGYDDMQPRRPRTNGDLLRSMDNLCLARLICRLGGIDTHGEAAIFAWLESEAKK